MPLFAADHPLLDPPTRTALVMALLAFVVMGLGLLAGILLGGRWARRFGGDQLKRPLPLRKPPRDEGDALAEDVARLRSADPSETIAEPLDPGETQAER